MSSISSINLATLGINSSQLENSATEADSRTTLDSNDFISLFLTELENQDPLDPMDTSTMADQLCSYSQLDQQIQTNEYLLSLIQYQSSVNNSQALETIGKMVSFEDNSVFVTDDSIDEMNFDLGEDASKVTISIYDEAGEEVASIELEDLNSGSNTYQWDGKDEYGNDVPPGEYSFKVTASDENGDPIEVVTFNSEIIESVEFKDGSPYLISESGRKIPFGNVMKVSQA